MRVSPEEFAVLKQAAGSVPVSRWVRSLALKAARGADGIRLSESFVAAVAREVEDQVGRMFEGRV